MLALNIQSSVLLESYVNQVLQRHKESANLVNIVNLLPKYPIYVLKASSLIVTRLDVCCVLLDSSATLRMEHPWSKLAE